ncbi:MAG: molybdenum ABC transporter ATP-binding protein [Planctomycetota bacterium]|jgi:molybdate transport system ATP-binding protein
MTLQIDIQLKRKGFNLIFQGEIQNGITGLFGPSGAGKTTLLHCIAGLTRPDAGRITLNETVLYDATSHHHLPPRKRRIGLVFQDHLLFPHISVAGNLAYGQNGARKGRKRQRCEIAELLEISHLLNRNVTRLSGGEKQRVALGRAILSSPQLLLLDEPFTGLDQGLKQQLIPYLKRLYEATKIPMIVVSHSAEEMSQLVQELFFIEKGEIYAQAELNKSHVSRKGVRFCNLDDPTGFQKARNLLIRNHSLKFPAAGKANAV